MTINVPIWALIVSAVIALIITIDCFVTLIVAIKVRRRIKEDDLSTLNKIARRINEECNPDPRWTDADGVDSGNQTGKVDT